MTDKRRIAVVEDNGPQRLILTRLLEAKYEIRAFASGEDFLAQHPAIDCVLLDIEMPGLNGYDTCRRFRSEAGDQVPVIFVSAHDTAPERVAAYEAGGDDFIIKPVAAHELLHKVEAALDHRRHVRDLENKSQAAQQIAFTAMTSMGDLGTVLDFMRKSAGVGNYAGLARLLLDAMHAWQLRGAVQVRGRSGELQRSHDTHASPLQASVMDTMREMGRIFELGSRAVINYDHVSLLVHNLPTDDPDKVGRLRDLLALLGEAADTRVAALDAQTERSERLNSVGASLEALQRAIRVSAERGRENRMTLQKHSLDLLDNLRRSLGRMGLTSIQEDYVNDMVREGADDLLHHFDEAQFIEHDFAEAIAQLEAFVREA